MSKFKISDWVCEGCDLSFSSKQALGLHTNVVCEKRQQKKLERTCPTCDKVLASKQMCLRHIEFKVCTKNGKIPLKQLKTNTPTDTCVTNPTDTGIDNNTDNGVNTNDTSDYESMSKTELIAELKRTKNTQQCQQNITNITNNNTINIIAPLAYKTDDNIKDIIKMLGDDTFKKLIVNNTRNSIPMLCSQIHANEKFKQLQNVYIANEHTSYARASDGSKFISVDKDTLIEEMVEGKRALLLQYIGDYGEQLGTKAIDKFNRYQDLIDTDKNFKKQVEHDVCGVLLDIGESCKKCDKMISKSRGAQLS